MSLVAVGELHDSFVPGTKAAGEHDPYAPRRARIDELTDSAPLWGGGLVEPVEHDQYVLVVAQKLAKPLGLAGIYGAPTQRGVNQAVPSQHVARLEDIGARCEQRQFNVVQSVCRPRAAREPH